MNAGTPEPGDLLVASTVLTDGVFDQTVVLVLEKSEDRSEESRRRYLQELSDAVWGSLSLSAYPETITERQEP